MLRIVNSPNERAIRQTVVLRTDEGMRRVTHAVGRSVGPRGESGSGSVLSLTVRRLLLADTAHSAAAVATSILRYPRSVPP